MTAFKTAIATWPIKPLINKLINTFWLISPNIVAVIRPFNVRRVAQTHSEDGIHVAVRPYFLKICFE